MPIYCDKCEAVIDRDEERTLVDGKDFCLNCVQRTFVDTRRDKIVLIVERDNTDSEVFGPFATREAAQEAEDEMVDNWDERAWSHVRGFTIATMQPVGSE